MDRINAYFGEVLTPLDLLRTEMNAYIATGRLSRAILGTGPWLNNFACTPTSPASMSVQIGQGELYILEPTDTTQYGEAPPNGIAANPTPLLKQGIFTGPQTITLTAPGGSGQSINYLIQIGFVEADDDIEQRTFISAPLFRDVSTMRSDGVLISAKAGTAATTGSQSTPSPDAGYVGAWVVTVAYGQTSISSGNINAYSNAPFLTDKLPSKITFAQGDTRYLQRNAAPNINYFINPILNIFQATDELNLAAGAAGYCADMIKHYCHAGTVQASKQLYAFGQALVPGATNYLTHQQTTSAAGNQIYFYAENAAQYSGQTVCCSFLVSASANIVISGEWFINFGSGGSALISGAASNGPFSISSTPTTINVILQIPSLEGKTPGNVTALGCALNLPGSSFSLNIYSAGFFLGDTAGAVYSQGFDYDLARCERFYQKSYSIDTYAGAATAEGAQMQGSWIKSSNGPDDAGFYFEFLRKPYAVTTSNIQIYDIAGNLGYISATNEGAPGPWINNITYYLGYPHDTNIWNLIPPSDRNFIFYINGSELDFPCYFHHWVVDCRF